MKKYIIPLVLVVLLGLILLSGYRFSPQQSLSATKIINGQQEEIILYQPTHYGQAVLFENKKDGTFGVAQLNRHLMVLWLYGGGTYGYNIENHQPFEAAGFGNSEKGKEQFIIGIKTNDNDIEYIAIGKGPQIPSGLDEKYDLDLKKVKEMIEDYKVTKVEDNFALIVTDEYNEESWTIIAFNKDGNLIADKLFGAEPRTLNK